MIKCMPLVTEMCYTLYRLNKLSACYPRNKTFEKPKLFLVPVAGAVFVIKISRIYVVLEHVSVSKRCL